jgi:competence protein ComEA
VSSAHARLPPADFLGAFRRDPTIVIRRERSSSSTVPPESPERHVSRDVPTPANAGGADGERLIAKLDEDEKSITERPTFPEPLRSPLTQRSFEMSSRHRQRSLSAHAPGRAAGYLSLATGLLLLSAASGHAGTTAAAPADPNGKVNINAASASQIAMLPRIGEKVATRVLEYRKAHGPFAKPEGLMEVKGIGEKLFLTLKPYLAVSGPTTLAAKVRLGSSRKRGAPSPAPKAAPKSAPASVPAGKGR